MRNSEVLKTDARRQAKPAHALVSKWTAKFDLFEKDYIIVPINEQCVLEQAIQLTPTVFTGTSR